MGFVSGVIDASAKTIFLPQGLGIVSTAATLEALVDNGNLVRAWERVRHNRGAPGVDGETIESLEADYYHRLPLLQSDLLAGTFRPQPVRAFQISKPSGSVRTLGIPTVTDRIVLEAIAQILTPVWEPAFSPFSFAYRPGQDAHAAVITAQRILQTGYRWVVDLDIEKFFDNVDHVRLMQRLGCRVVDVRILDLIADFLRAGQSWNGEVRSTRVGTRVHLAGLDPALGHLHASTDDRCALALDLMEPFRPAVSEALTLRLFTQAILAQEDFEPHEGGVYLAADGRKKWLLHYERRMEREFMSEFAEHRTTLRRQLDQIVAEYKRGLDDPESFRPFRVN